MSENVRVVKINESQNLVFGWGYVSISKDGSQVLDHSTEFVEPEDLEMAAYAFNLTFRQAGVNHQGEAVGHLVESFVSTPDKLEALGLEKSALPVGLWLGFHIPDDEIFAKVKSGEYGMFSIQGRAVREAM